MKTVTKAQATVIKSISDMIMKAVFGLASLVFISIILYHIISSECDWKNKASYALLEGILFYTTFRAFKHYFPLIESDKEKKS